MFGVDERAVRLHFPLPYIVNFEFSGFTSMFCLSNPYIQTRSYISTQNTYCPLSILHSLTDMGAASSKAKLNKPFIAITGRDLKEVEATQSALTRSSLNKTASEAATKAVATKIVTGKVICFFSAYVLISMQSADLISFALTDDLFSSPAIDLFSECCGVMLVVNESQFRESEEVQTQCKADFDSIRKWSTSKAVASTDSTKTPSPILVTLVQFADPSSSLSSAALKKAEVRRLLNLDSLPSIYSVRLDAAITNEQPNESLVQALKWLCEWGKQSKALKHDISVC